MENFTAKLSRIMHYKLSTVPNIPQIKSLPSIQHACGCPTTASVSYANLGQRSSEQNTDAQHTAFQSQAPG